VQGYRPEAMRNLASEAEVRLRWGALESFYLAHGHFLSINEPRNINCWSSSDCCSRWKVSCVWYGAPILSRPANTLGITFFPEIELALLYIIAATVLLIRPTGLFGRA
jgi:hypothetical protein